MLSSRQLLLNKTKAKDLLKPGFICLELAVVIPATFFVADLPIVPSLVHVLLNFFSIKIKDAQKVIIFLTFLLNDINQFTVQNLFF